MRVRAAWLLLLVAACSTTTAPAVVAPRTVRVVLFGDSNTDGGWDASNVLVEASYISESTLRLSPTAPNGSHQLAGKLEALSTAGLTLHAVNHGASGTGTGDGRHPSGSPNARLVWAGVTRFEAEVLGRGGSAWDGGESKPRVQAFVPTAQDFAYVSMGTNDRTSYGLTATETLANLAWMADRWTAAGLPASHLLVTTLPPRTSGDGSQIVAINAGVRTLAASRGLTLIDLSRQLSDDNGVTWRSPTLHIGDGVHYTEAVRGWLAGQVLARMQ